jgi:hypothetical protein
MPTTTTALIAYDAAPGQRSTTMLRDRQSPAISAFTNSAPKVEVKSWCDCCSGRPAFDYKLRVVLHSMMWVPAPLKVKVKGRLQVRLPAGPPKVKVTMQRVWFGGVIQCKMNVHQFDI